MNRSRTPSTHSLELLPYRGPEGDPRPPVGGFLAAVALVLTDHPGASSTPPPHFLLIRRAQSKRDPWSGHMALPGGRKHPGDGSLLTTAIRETREETGVDLSQSGRLLGCLPPVAPAGSGLPSLTILPFVFQLTGDVDPRPQPDEVAEILWTPLTILDRDEHRGVHHHSMGSVKMAFPSILVEGHPVWGLTHRILKEFQQRLG